MHILVRTIKIHRGQGYPSTAKILTLASTYLIPAWRQFCSWKWILSRYTSRNVRIQESYTSRRRFGPMCSTGIPIHFRRTSLSRYLNLSTASTESIPETYLHVTISSQQGFVRTFRFTTTTSRLMFQAYVSF